MTGLTPWGRPFVRSLQGAFLGIGAPLGWLAIQFIMGVDPGSSLSATPVLYSYMLLGTVIVFAGFGWYVGRQEHNYQYLSLHDHLTGLHNNRYFWMQLRQAHANAVRHRQALSVIVMDLDHFKEVNDRHGHAVGDALLSAVGHALLKTGRAGEILARVGGEEFAAILPAAVPSEGLLAAERFRSCIDAAIVKLQSGDFLRVSASAGVACYRDGRPASPEELFRQADEAMYSAKQQGRNRAVMAGGFSPA